MSFFLTHTFVTSVRLMARSNSAPTVRIFMKSDIWAFFVKTCPEIHQHVTRERPLYIKTNIHFWSHLFNFFLHLWMFQTKFVEKIKTLLLYAINFYWNPAMCEKMCEEKTRNILLHFYFSNGNANAPLCHFILHCLYC